MDDEFAAVRINDTGKSPAAIEFHHLGNIVFRQIGDAVKLSPLLPAGYHIRPVCNLFFSILPIVDCADMAAIGKHKFFQIVPGQGGRTFNRGNAPAVVKGQEHLIKTGIRIRPYYSPGLVPIADPAEHIRRFGKDLLIRIHRT